MHECWRNLLLYKFDHSSQVHFWSFLQHVIPTLLCLSRWQIHCTMFLLITAKSPAISPGYFCGKLKPQHSSSMTLLGLIRDYVMAQIPIMGPEFQTIGAYGKCPKNSNTKASDKMTYANSVDPDQTAPEEAV